MWMYNVILGKDGISDNDDDDDDSDDDDDEQSQDLSLEIDDLVKGLIPGKSNEDVASEWASLSVHVFPIVLHAGHSVRLTPLYRLKLLLTCCLNFCSHVN